MQSFNNGNAGMAEDLMEGNKKVFCNFFLGVMHYNQKELSAQTDVPCYLQEQFNFQKDSNLELTIKSESYIQNSSQNCS